MSLSNVPRRLVGGLVAMLVVAGFAAAGAAAISSSIHRGPAGLRFYSPPKKLPPGPHGTLIWARPFRGVAALSRASNELVLYKQTSLSGGTTEVSGVVSVPNGKAPKGGWPVITWAHGTTGIAPACAPSRDTGKASGADAADRGTAALFDSWIRHGWAVVRTDYEGEGGPGVHPYLIGPSEGRGVLDIVRAARQLDPQIGRRMIISGHSQGGHAALWAASLASSYTPELDLLGTVAFAPQSHTAQEVSLLQSVSTAGLTPLAALILRGLDVAYPALHLSSVLTPAGAALYPQTETVCLKGLEAKSSFGGLPLNRLVASNADLSAALADLAANDPQNLKIKGPVLLEQGLADMTVFPSFDMQLSQSLAAVGDRVSYHTYRGASHGGVLIAAASDATAFIGSRLGHR